MPFHLHHLSRFYLLLHIKTLSIFEQYKLKLLIYIKFSEFAMQL